MKNTILPLLFIILLFEFGFLQGQGVKPDKICYDLKDPVELKCKYNSIFYKNRSTAPITAINIDKDKYEVTSNQANDLRTLKIIKTDRQDNGLEAYRGADFDNGNLICVYDMLRYNDKSKHKGEFKLDNLTPIRLLSGFTQSPTDIPTIKVPNPNDVSIPVHFSFEALPLKSIEISVNNETIISENICETKTDDEIDCVEFNDTLTNKNECPNNKIQLNLSYTLNDWLNCSLETVGSFKYEFIIEYPPTNINLSSNLLQSESAEFDYKAKLGDFAEFKESVSCANPNKIKYNRKITTTYLNENETTVTLPQSENNKFEIIFNEEFATKVIESCMSNGIGEPKCIKVSIEYYEELTSYDSSSNIPFITPTVTSTTPQNETIKHERICYDKDAIEPIELKCEYNTIFFKKESNIPITSTTNPFVYEIVSDRPNNLRILKIKRTDKSDNGSEAYRAEDINSNTICTYDLLRRNDKSKHKGVFKLDNLTPIKLLSGFTQSTIDIPTINTTYLNQVIIPVFYSFEALPLKSIEISVNNETTRYENVCKTKNDDDVDCVVFNGTLIIENICPNNKIELSLSYTLNDWLNCSLETVGPFKYEFMIQYPPLFFYRIDNIIPVGSSDFDYKAKLGDVAVFKAFILCANPSIIKYNSQIITKYFNETEIIVTLPETKNNTFEISFNDVFAIKIIETCLSNGIGDPSCYKTSVAYYEGFNSKGPSNPLWKIVGTIVGSIFGLVLIITISVFVFKKFHKREKKTNEHVYEEPYVEMNPYENPNEYHQNNYYKGLNTRVK